MNIPLLDLKAQYQTIKEDIDEAIKKVVESQYFILSPEVSELEKEISSYTGTLFAAGVASGTDAIILALRAAGVGSGDYVITTPFTFFATAESISAVGAKPIFVDIKEDSYNIDSEKVKEVLEKTSEEELKKIKAIIPVHLYGQCSDMDPIMDLSDKYNLAVIEDCAQAIGATYKGRAAGSFGIAGCFSFFPSKNLGGFGDGGMIVSSEKAIIDRVKILRVHGSKEQYLHEEIGYNSRLDSLQAAILRVKLKNLDKWLDARRKIADKYNKAFSGIGIVTPKVSEGNVHTYHQYTIAVDDRDKFLEHLKTNSVAARVYYPIPLHLQACYGALGYSEGSFPVSEKLSKNILSLPIYPDLTDEQSGYVVDTVKGFFK